MFPTPIQKGLKAIQILMKPDEWARFAEGPGAIADVRRDLAGMLARRGIQDGFRERVETLDVALSSWTGEWVVVPDAIVKAARACFEYEPDSLEPDEDDRIRAEIDGVLDELRRRSTLTLVSLSNPIVSLHFHAGGDVAPPLVERIQERVFEDRDIHERYLLRDENRVLLIAEPVTAETLLMGYESDEISLGMLLVYWNKALERLRELVPDIE